MQTRQSLQKQKDDRIKLAQGLLMSHKIDGREFLAQSKEIDGWFSREVRRGEFRPLRRCRLQVLAGALAFAVGVVLALSGGGPFQVRGGILLILAGFLAVAHAHIRLLATCMESLSRVVGPTVRQLLVERPGFDSDLAEVRVSCLVVHLKNHRALRESGGATVLAQLLGELHEFMAQAVHARGGILRAGFDGTFHITFGPPGEATDHLVRAVEVAVKLMESLKGRDYHLGASFPAVHLGLGIHTGPAAVGLVGRQGAVSCEAVGSAVDIAEELAQATGWDEILISETVSREVEGLFRVEPREPMFCVCLNEILKICSVLGGRSEATPRA